MEVVQEEHCARVPFAGRLKQEAETFCDARRQWQERGVECQDALHFVRNFLNKTRTRARGGDEEYENSDDLLSDDELVVSMETLQEATKTHVGGKKPGTMGDDQDLEKGISHHENSTNAIGHVDAVLGSGIHNGKRS